LLKPLPSDVYVYDIEGGSNFPDVLKMMLEEKVYITEKAEGSHFAIHLEGEEVHICQRRFEVVQKEGEEEIHTFIKTANEGGYVDVAKKLRNFLTSKYPNMRTFTLRGEMLGPGVQSNIYHLTKHEVKLFEMEVDGIPVDSVTFWDAIYKFGLQDRTVHLIAGPVILREWLDGETFENASNGASNMFSSYTGLREGIVVKPEREHIVENFGRMILKMRSPEYLAKSEF
jgi:hypothetical protein